ncbi:MAG: hypothetical protein JSV80_12720 [Acidobacteriota bacterium]|nr:MAG: hypothetical protein JSV80_12720 [Acidobacteriota bacterium]
MTSWWGFDETAGSTAQDIGGAIANDAADSGTPSSIPGTDGGSLCFGGSAESAVDPDHDEVDYLEDCSGAGSGLLPRDSK